MIVGLRRQRRRDRVRRLRARRRRVSQVGPATPDHTIYTKRLPCFVPSSTGARDPAVDWTAVESAVERFVRDYTAYVDGPSRRGRRAAGRAAAGGAGAGARHVHRRRDARTAGIVKRHLPPHDRRARRTPPPSAATSRSPPRTPSTSSTGRSSSTSSRWRRRRRSWPGASRSSPAAAPASAAPWRSAWPPRARTWRSTDVDADSARAGGRRGDQGASAAGARSGSAWTSPARPSVRAAFEATVLA